MAGQTLIARHPHGLEALTAFNRPVFESHDEIVSTVARGLGGRHAALFARPAILADGSIAWTTDVPGPAARWIDLPAERRRSLEPERLRLGEDLARLAADFARSGINTRQGNMAQILAAAQEVPGSENLHVVGDQFVLTFWGFRQQAGSPFNPFAQGVPVPQADPPAPQAGPPSAAPVRRGCLPWILLAALLAALLALLAWWWFCRKPVEPPAVPPPMEEAPRPAEPPPPEAAAPPAEPEEPVEFEKPPPLPEVPPPAPEVPPPPPPEAALPPCPEERPKEEAPDVVIVLDISLSMGFPADVDPELFDQVWKEANQSENIFARIAAITELRRLREQSVINRMDAAMPAVVEVIRSLPSDVSIGLVTVGGCPSAEIVGIYSSAGRESLIRSLLNTQLVESTPLASGLMEAGSLMAQLGGDGLILVVSDGEDSCNGDPCAAAQALAGRLPGVTVNLLDVFGTGNRSCVVAPSGGQVFKPNNASDVLNLLERATESVQAPAHCKKR